jgi:HEAT repeat protein
VADTSDRNRHHLVVATFRERRRENEPVSPSHESDDFKITEYLVIEGIRLPISSEADRAAAADAIAEDHAANAIAESLHTTQELQDGMRHPDPNVRWRVVPRLRVRAGTDPGSLPLLLELLYSDPSWMVRDSIVEELPNFGLTEEIVAHLRAVEQRDESKEVRETARWLLHNYGKD